MSHDSADPHIRLAVYGTLGPGRPNHHQLSALRGRWVRGSGPRTAARRQKGGAPPWAIPN